jgi:tRNA modification GTPase
MLPRAHDPILALATATGRGAVGIVRISGRDLKPLVQQLFGKQLNPREACYLPFSDAQGQPIDRGLALYFPAPNSFTGEDVLELQAHGGPVVLQLLMASCLQAAQEHADLQTRELTTVLPGLRLAEPGEFSQRAFLNGKLDLAQAEAIADLIDASTEAAARSATQSLSGVFSRDIQQVRDALVHLRMLVEATLDFPEEDIDFLEKADAQGQLDRLQASLEGVLSRARQGALLREGMKVVIAGQPNAGKSSLLNALAGAELAIVTPIAGTTRDRVQETIQIEGVPLHIVDTAGLRPSDDLVEKIGIERAWESIRSADAVLLLHDLTRIADPDYRSADSEIRRTLQSQLPAKTQLIEVWNKLDCGGLPEMPEDGLCVSARTGDGLEALRRRLLQAAGWQAATGGIYTARERHVQALRQVQNHLMHAQEHLRARAQSLDLMAEELRLAQNALNTITGAFGADELLGEIFSRFCIGK